MKMLLINGPVVDDGDAWYYDYFGDPYVSPKYVRDFLNDANGENIQVSINSGGGSVFAGSEIYTMLKSYSGRVDVVVSGLAASIASIIMLAGDSVKASPMAQIMIHNAQMGQWGDYRDMEHASVVIGGVSQSLVGIYTAKTGLSAERIKEFVDQESWFGAERAKELGFVDEVLFQDTVAFVASAGRYVDKAKIMEFKAMKERAQLADSPNNLILEKLEALENRLDKLETQPVSDMTVSIDAGAIEAAIKKCIAEEKEEVSSPFAKFV